MVKIPFVCPRMLLVCGLLCLFCSCFRHSGTEPEAAGFARERLWGTEYTINKFYRLVEPSCLTSGCVVTLEDEELRWISWTVPETGYIAMLHEEPNRHEPEKRLLRLVAFMPRDRDGIRFVSKTNAIAEVISIQMETGILVTNISWSQF